MARVALSRTRMRAVGKAFTWTTAGLKLQFITLGAPLHVSYCRFICIFKTGAFRPSPSRLDARGSARAIRTAVSETDVSRAERSSAALRSDRGANLHAAFDQDRRLSG